MAGDRPDSHGSSNCYRTSSRAKGRSRITKPMGPIRLIEVAELLGVSKQRAHQIADEPGFPNPVAEDGRGRLWDRREVAAWAKRWRGEKPWR